GLQPRVLLRDVEPDRVHDARGGRGDDGDRQRDHQPDDQGGGPVTESLGLVAAGLITLTGLAIVGVGLRWQQSTAIEDLLAEFEGTTADLDEYTQRMQSPFAIRMLGPLGQRVLAALQSLLPRNYVAGVRRRLVLAGLSGRFGAEEYVAGQVVGTAIGVLV